MDRSAELVVLVIDRPNVAIMNISPPLRALEKLSESAETARQYASSVMVTFEGYGDAEPEVFEDDLVREFVQRLTARWPYWLHFAYKGDDSLRALLFCLIPKPQVVRLPHGRIQTAIDMEEVKDKLMELFGYLNGLYEDLGLNEEENAAMTAEVQQWFARSFT